MPDHTYSDIQLPAIRGHRWEVRRHNDTFWAMRLWTRRAEWAGEVQFFTDPDRLVLRYIFVTPRFRGEGLGSKLLQAVLAGYQDTPIELRVEAQPGSALDDTALMAWYARYGFLPQLTRPGWLVRLAEVVAVPELQGEWLEKASGQAPGSTSSNTR